jgi:hypothetical protein
MLKLIETWSSELIKKPELKISNNKGCRLRTVIKDNKESYSDIWSPGMDILMKERRNITQ